ncbi:GTPase and tRNA-U34 5-formylation enzyme TrmE [Enhygromyxa salina]|uniref:GTPase and tRNA-U34 5-formylation enzyme TrmE n=1 Tax=Enhygromyxa salina TaxID=215803 RepID=A0A0C1Z4R6_9BACT|nr:GTPase [Enhygromyxa salina]KIG12644.1 GTPase and tRNA-U34 5-formylation enzyme TrmE [Enhygromyxa salina]
MPEHHTIAGVATGSPDGGVAIIRVSGSEALSIAKALIMGELPAPRVLAVRRLVVGGERALVGVMPGPRSFTGEDVVELHVHAGARNVGQILEAVLEAGAVAAQAGDFTRRAFGNRRLSLDQAEGIAALIGAQTQAALDQARRLVAGELGREVEAVRQKVELLRVEIEANLDFPEDVDARDEARFAATAASLGEAVEGWLAGFERGRLARSRARVVIAGPPNAGKSALFNALLGRRRALVSATAGTTRDYVEAELTLEGRELCLVDTAGLRESADNIEVAGVELGREQIASADVIVWVEGADQSVGLSRDDHDNLNIAAGASLIRVENKQELGRRRPEWIGVSAEPGTELEPLRRAIADAVTLGGEQWIGLARHRDRAREASPTRLGPCR